jgi:hypothetical protein
MTLMAEKSRLENDSIGDMSLSCIYTNDAGMVGTTRAIKNAPVAANC